MDNQQNSGQFMNPGGNGIPGMGPALTRLLQQRQGTLNQNTASPQAVLPASPNQGSALPQGFGPQSSQPSAQVSQGTASPQQALPPDAQERQIALRALSQFLASHGKALEARHGIMK